MSDSPDFAEKFLRRLRQTKTNEEFFEVLSTEPKGSGTGRRMM
jgi:transcription termination factor Rho